MDERIKRITEMEQRLNRLLAWNRGDRTTTKEIIQEDVRLLDEYYRSPLWREDYEADEAGELPKDLPRGVLSEDGIYNALEDYTMQTEEKIPPEQALHDMTLAMIYLTRFTDGRMKKYEDPPLLRAWKSYDWDTVQNWLKKLEDCLERHRDVRKTLKEILPTYHEAG